MWLRAKLAVFLPIRADQNLCPPLLKTEMTPLLLLGIDVLYFVFEITTIVSYYKKYIFFFVSVITVQGGNTALIFFKSILFDGKVNLVAAFSRSRF